MDVVKFVDFGCALFEQNHYTTLLISTLAPLGLCVCILIVDQMIQLSAKSSAETARDVTYTLLLAIAFLVYPSVSATVLRTFDCESYELFDGSTLWLRTDHTLSCQDATYTSYLIYASFMVVLYIVGIPVLFSVILWSQRTSIRDKTVEDRDKDKTAARSHFLWSPYVPKRFYFEVVELIRKLAQTSILVFIAPGTSLQFVFVLVVTAFAIMIFSATHPYLKAGDNFLAVAAQWSILGITFLSLLLKIDSRLQDDSSCVASFDERRYDVAILNVLLVLMFLAIPILAFGLAVWNVVWRWRGKKVHELDVRVGNEGA
jgi:hypothetical protein